MSRHCNRLVLAVLAFWLLEGSIVADAAVRFVKTTGNNAHNGLSWDTAKRTVAAGLGASAAGDQVWVTKGTYVERITLKPDVALYGGFGGIEDPNNFDLSERQFSINETILNGNGGGSVVIGPVGATSTCRIDGFTITGGSASEGGGIRLSYSSPTIAYNRISGNGVGSGFGGGLYVYHSSPLITHNRIVNNSAGSGGGLYLFGSSAVVDNNEVVDNDGGGAGGGMFIEASTPTISSNAVMANDSSRGGGLYVSFSLATIEDNAVTGNVTTSYGGGLELLAVSGAIAGNVITGNIAGPDGGGGLYLCESFPNIEYNTISGNTGGAGGGLSMLSSSPRITRNSITVNSSSLDGGGIFVMGFSAPEVMYNSIVGNNSGGSGGGLWLDTNENGTVIVAYNTVAHNVAQLHGGGMYLVGGAPFVSNNMITSNSAQYDGGGIYARFCKAIVRTNTVAYNTALNGGAMIVYGIVAPSLTNTIAAFNSSGICMGSDRERGLRSVAPTLSHDCVYGNALYDFSGFPDPTGANGNISADPLFADPNDGNYHLLAGSPCVNSGTAAHSGWDQVDWDGEPRVMGGRIDIGADEFTARPFLFGDANCDGLRNFADIDAFVVALAGPDAYAAAYPDCFWDNADCNDDETVDGSDIDLFVIYLAAR